MPVHTVAGEAILIQSVQKKKKKKIRHYELLPIAPLNSLKLTIHTSLALHTTHISQ